MEMGLYIHIPFCQSKCGYCDFLSYAQREDLFEDYRDALMQEIENCQELREGCIQTLFIGGGTPSVLPPFFLAQILEHVARYASGVPKEVTLEGNPGSISATACQVWKAAGVNRLSIGLQAWQNRLLTALGRIHCRQDFLKSYQEARETGFKNINIDLMFSLPGQTQEDWLETLEQVTALNPEHLSVYALTLEENTPFGQKKRQGLLTEVGEAEDRAFYRRAQLVLEARGYRQYEISNFAQSGRECLHNLGYWQRKNYIGLGLSAHSFWQGVRFHNTNQLERYIKAQGDCQQLREDFEVIHRRAAQAEFMFLGLRQTRGITGEEFYGQFGCELGAVYGQEIRQLCGQGLLCQSGNRVFLTCRGVDLSNYVFQTFL